MSAFNSFKGKTLVQMKIHANEQQAEIDRLRSDLLAQDDYIALHLASGRNGDWACAECKPHSDMIIAGFVCGYHRALHRQSLRAE